MPLTFSILVLQMLLDRSRKVSSWGNKVHVAFVFSRLRLTSDQAVQNVLH